MVMATIFLNASQGRDVIARCHVIAVNITYALQIYREYHFTPQIEQLMFIKRFGIMSIYDFSLSPDITPNFLYCKEARNKET